MNKALIWAITNGAMLGLVIAGVSGFGPAYLIFTFWIWVLFVLYILTLWIGFKTDEPIKQPVPHWLDIGYDIVVASILAGSSHVFMAVIYLVTMTLQRILIARINTALKTVRV